eukprot:6208333-Pleurochrysis_carterae.AAC.2
MLYSTERGRLALLPLKWGMKLAPSPPVASLRVSVWSLQVSTDTAVFLSVARVNDFRYYEFHDSTAPHRTILYDQTMRNHH